MPEREKETRSESWQPNDFEGLDLTGSVLSLAVEVKYLWQSV